MIAVCTECIERNFSKSNFLIKLYGLYYRNIVKNEVKLAGIRSCDRILCIGGGPIPSTAIEMARQTDACVHVIDMDGTAVVCARDVIKKLGLAHKITVEQARGEEVDISPYNVIHVALQVIEGRYHALRQYVDAGRGGRDGAGLQRIAQLTLKR